MTLDRREKRNTDVKKFPIMAALLLGGFISLLSETLLNVALPRFMEEFRISANVAGWLVTGYLLVIGVCVPAAAFLMRKFRTRILYFASMAFFIAGTLICMSAAHFPVLLAGRLVQAVGTAILMPLMLNTVLVLNPPEKRGKANGIVILVIMFAPAVGPTLSGFILQSYSWRALFLCTLPLSVIALLIGVIFMRDVTKITNPRFDPVSMIFSTLGFGLFIYGLSLVGHVGLRGTLCLIAGVISLVIFIIRQLKLRDPMLDLTVFRFPRYTLGVVYVCTAMIALFSNLMMMPIFLQKVLVLSTLATGLVMMPSGFLNGAVALITGGFYDKFGSKYLLPAGFIIILAVLTVFTSLDGRSSVTHIIIFLCLLGIGVPFVMASSQTDGLNSLPQEYYPHGTAVLNTVQQISAALGSSFFINVMTTAQIWFTENSQNTADQISSLTFGIQTSYKVGCVFVAVPLVMSLVQFVYRIKTEGAGIGSENKK